MSSRHRSFYHNKIGGFFYIFFPSMQRYNLRRFFCGMCSVEAWVVYPTSRNITPSSCAKSCQARMRAASLAANTMSLLIFHRIVNALFWWVLASVNHLIRFFDGGESMCFAPRKGEVPDGYSGGKCGNCGAFRGLVRNRYILKAEICPGTYLCF